MGKVERIRAIEPDLSSPARKVLADLMEQHLKAKASQDEALAALSRAKNAVREAESRKDNAERALEQAKEAHIAHITDAASSGEPLASFRPLREARIEATEAQDNLDAVNAAIVVLQSAAEQADEVTRSAAVAIRSAAKDVIAVEVNRLLFEAKDLQKRLIDRRAALRAITVDLGIDGGPIAADLQKFLGDRALPGGFGSVEYRDWSNHPSAHPWKAAFHHLLMNPDTPLPK